MQTNNPAGEGPLDCAVGRPVPERKERPILFSAPMVRALLAGTKTQTRRVAKIDDVAYGSPVRWVSVAPATTGLQNVPCPYGEPGDRLWVRETWYCDDYRVQCGPFLRPDDLDVVDARADGTLCYAADNRRPYEAEQPIWRPSIHMPRWASRITLEVTGVRVERLQDISEADAIAEGGTEALHGWWTHEGLKWNDPGPNDRFGGTPIDSYRVLWERINGPGSWDANPWVWVVEFRKTPNAKLT